LFKAYSDLTKFGIVVFALLSGMAGYSTSFAIESVFSWAHLLTTMMGLYALSSGSLALNQIQECEIDKKMPRTASRPIASGKISPRTASIISVSLLVTGFVLLYLASVAAFVVGVISVILYNGIYTIYLKQWRFGAVPGAIPGALPVTIGYAANDMNVFTRDSIYLFLIMFLWQIPHFWVLAIKYKEDYQKGGIPVLPVASGNEFTLFQIGIYTFLYVLVATLSPWFTHASWTYLLVVLPISFYIIKQLFVYTQSKGEKWFRFYMTLNLSMLIFLFVPVVDKWNFLFIKSN
jgi:protoheme IX farnesyltransferase